MALREIESGTYDTDAWNPGIHDLENVGDTVMRFTTVELLD